MDLLASFADFRRASSIVGLGLALMPRPAVSNTMYQQTNLVSDISGLATATDPNLKNPWGVSFGPAGPFWVSDQVTNVATLYNGSSVVPLVVSMPPAASNPDGPTGQVFNSAGAGFGGNIFLFATLAGTINGWNGGTSASVLATSTGAVYTGLAMATNPSGTFLYAANANGNIDVYDSSVHPTTVPGTFTDPNLPAGYRPYNIQNIGGKLYVAYSKGVGAGLGVVSEFDANGNFLKEVIAAGGALNAPWGMVIAPTGFGTFSNDLLVGNFGNGEINAFDPTTGAFLGTLEGTNGNPLVNSGLWSLSVRTAGNFNLDAVYFTAGINGQQDGLFGSIAPSLVSPTPEPSTLLLCFSSGLMGLARLTIRRRGNRRTACVPKASSPRLRRS